MCAINIAQSEGFVNTPFAAGLLINPFTFYGFFEKKDDEQKDKLDKLVAALKKNECDKDKLNESYRCIRGVQKEYEKFKTQGGK